MGERHFLCNVGKSQASLNKFEASMQHLGSFLLELLVALVVSMQEKRSISS